jgi:hypothetical protein
MDFLKSGLKVADSLALIAWVMSLVLGGDKPLNFWLVAALAFLLLTALVWGIEARLRTRENEKLSPPPMFDIGRVGVAKLTENEPRGSLLRSDRVDTLTAWRNRTSNEQTSEETKAHQADRS